MSFTVVLDMCFHTLKNETNNAHKHILITTRYCQCNTPPGIPIDLPSSSLLPYWGQQRHIFHTNSYPHVFVLYRSLNFIVCLKRYHFCTSWPQTAKLGKIRHTDNKNHFYPYIIATPSWVEDPTIGARSAL